MVNCIKTRAVKSRLFELVCKDVDSQHVRLLLHTEVRWLSKGKVLARVNEFQKELFSFFEHEGHDRFCEYLNDELWMPTVEYLTEFFGHLSSLTSNMQGRNENILTSTDKLVAFKKKLSPWNNRVNAGNLDMFPLIRKRSIEKMTPIIVEHLTIFENRIEKYFPSINIQDFDWFRDPFADLTATNPCNWSCMTRKN